MDARAQRAVRGVAGTGIATTVAAVSHTVGGGSAPMPGLVAAIALLTAPLAVLAVGRRLALWRVALTVLGSQAALHATFATVGTAAPAASGRSTAHAHGALELGALELGALDAPLAAFAPTPLMMAAHVLAAVATIALLYRGEAALRGLARLVWDVAAPPLTELSPPIARPVLLPAPRFAGRIGPAAATAPILRRGPPRSSRPQ